MSWRDRLFDLDKGWTWIVSLSLFLVTAVADLATGYELNLVSFYIIPVLMLTWVVGAWWGALLAIASAGVMLGLGMGLTGRAPAPLGVVLFNIAGILTTYLVLVLVTNALRRSFAREKALARADALTGAANRTVFYDRLWLETVRLDRHGRPFCLIYLDCDNFKAVNDQWGHHRGDEVLRLLAQTGQAALRREDLLARLGGDEFAVLLPETGAQAGWLVAEKLRGALDRAMAAAGWPVTFSLGLVLVTAPGQTVDQVIEAADRVMYQVKKSGKNGLKALTLEKPGPPVALPAS